MAQPSDTLRWSDLPHAPLPGTQVVLDKPLADGEVRMVLMGPPERPEAFSVLLLCTADAVQAYVNRCAHFGVPLSARQEHLKFVPHVSISCNVHYARYRWSDGVCDRGDCVGERLIPIPVTVEPDGRVRIAASG